MSDVTARNQTRNQVAFDYDFSKLFLFNNKYRKVSITNGTANALVLTEGMLIGAVDGTYQVYKSGTSNISFVGILGDTVTIAAGDTAEVTLCIGGRVNSSLLIFDGTDTLTTVVNHKTILQIIENDSIDIEVMIVDQLSKYDN